MIQLSTEQIVIGKVLQDNTLADEVFSQLIAEDFTEEPQRETFKVLKSLHDSGVDLNIDIVLDKLDERKKEVGYSVDELDDIVANMIYVQSPVRVFINEMLDASNIRKQRQTVRAILDKLENKLDYSDELESLRQNQYSGDRFRVKSMADAIEAYDGSLIDSYGQNIPTGFKTLDGQLNGGLRKGWFYIIGARSGHGKTAIASNMFRNIVHAGKVPYYITLEMKAMDIAGRMNSGESGLTEKAIPKDVVRYANAVDAMKKWSAYFDDQARTIDEIERRSRHAVKQLNADVIFIDYIGLVQGKTGRSRIEEIAEYSRRLANLSKELDRPVVCLSQINRDADKRKPLSISGYDFKVPTMIELADSSSLEKDADCIIMLAVAEDVETGERPLLMNGQNPAIVRIEKNRKGEKGKIIKLSFNGGTTNFSEGGW